MLTRETEITDLFRAKAIEWNLSKPQILYAVQLAMSDKMLRTSKGLIRRLSNGRLFVDTGITDLKLFLYAKIFNSDHSPRERIVIQEILTPSTVFLEKRRQRLSAIVESQEQSPATPSIGIHVVENPFTSLFDAFVQTYPEWSSAMTSFVFHRDHESTKNKQHVLKERIIPSGLCYMHASTILQHYLVSMHPQVEHAPTLDIPSYLRKHMSSRSLYKHIWDDEGDSSLDFLLSILHENVSHRDVITYHPQYLIKSQADICSNLMQHGPALVSNFKVYDSFTSANKQHLGIPQGDYLGNHSMVLIGSRTDVNGCYRFLLQNWWANKPYVEVDFMYLVNCSAEIHFITVPQSEMGNFDGSMADYAENVEGIDCAEQMPREGTN